MPAIAIEIRYFDGRREERRFTQATITIGREAGDVVLADPQSSARHGEIHLNSGGATYRDTHSTNGSYLSTGQRISGVQPLLAGTEIRIGQSVLFIQNVQLGAALGPSGTVVIESASALPAQQPPQFGEPAKAPGAVAPGSQSSASGGSPYGSLPGNEDGAAAAMARSPDAAAPSRSLDPVAFVAQCLRDYRPLWLEGAKVIGVFLVPLALIEGLAGYVPVVGVVIALLVGLAHALLMFVFGFGAQAEFAMRTAAGLPAAAQQVWTIQLRRAIPWFIGILVPLLVSMVGCFVTLILFGALLLPVYMVEDKRMLDVNLRSFELLKKDWAGVLGPALLVGFPILLMHWLILLVFGVLPFVGELLAALAGALFISVASPFATFVQFRVYYSVRYRHENHDAAGEVRARFGE